MTRFSKIRFGEGLDVTDEGAGVIRVDGGAGVAGPPGPTGPAGPSVDISGKVDRDAVETATARLVAVKLAAGDTQPAFRILGDGKHEWGQGGTTALDTNLYRVASGGLKTNGYMQAAGTIEANAGSANDVALGHNGSIVTAGMFFGDSADTNLYRAAAGKLRTDGQLYAPGGVTTFIKGGAPTDADFAGTGGAQDGLLSLDVSTGRFYYRAGGVWRSILGT